MTATLLTMVPQSLNAQAMPAHREFVYGLQARVGRDYVGVFSPAKIQGIYVLADSVAVLLPRYTLVYYWAIDRQYKPDWTSLNEPVRGTLHVMKDGRVLKRVAASKYLIVPREGGEWAGQRVLLNDDADRVYAGYVRRRDRYLAAVAEYDSKLEKYLTQRARNPNDRTLQPPAQPQVFNEEMTPPQEGYPLVLPPGTYDVVLSGLDDRPIPESSRRVVAVAPRREALGYDVIPEARWTVPEASDDRNHVIYYSGLASAIYLRPVLIREFNEQQYARLTQPQDTLASADRWSWVHGEPVTEGDLKVFAGRRQMATLTIRPFVVRQTPGPALGYEIVPFEANMALAPDLQAIAVPIKADVDAMTVHLSRADGSVVVGSERVLVRARDDVPLPGYGLTVLPLAIGIGIKTWRRRTRARTLRNLAAAGT